MMHLRRATLLILMALGLLTACGQATGSSGAAANQPDKHTTDAGNPQQTTGKGLQPVLATSELVAGPNRLAFGLLENNVPIPDAAQTQVKARYYKVNGTTATLVAEEAARFYGEGLGPRGTFVVYPTFDTPGTWGLEVLAQRPGQSVAVQRLNLEVKAKGSAAPIGADAPRSKTPTAGEVQDLKTITSATKPDPRLYQLSVDQAVGSGKPSLILFATPGFCQTAVCGPGVDVLSRLADKFGDRVNAVHVEIYRYPFEELKPVPAMQEWGLQTEPWLFLVDKDGRIAGRYEGGITFQELEPAVAKLVQQGS